MRSQCESTGLTDAGIWRISLETGKSSLIVPFAEANPLPTRRGPARSWFNHLLFSPDAGRGSLHRWGIRQPVAIPFTTRMFTARPDGTDLYPSTPTATPRTTSGATAASSPGPGILRRK
jgi:hypothetical protein